jgi:2-octaprenyl-6-methoxyphenol hydroxylase
LRTVMYEAAARETLITFLPNARVATRERGAHGVSVTLSDGRVLKGSLLVAAEGRRSPTRDEAGFTPARWDYGHRAIIAGLVHEKSHENVAWEIFYPAGPFALLPLLDDEAGRHRSALVWTVAEKDAAGVVAMSETAFLREVEKRMGGVFGAITLNGARSSYPLNFHHTVRVVEDRLALVGDAAHGMHPIAGQGLNLGLRDVAALAEVVITAARLGQDIGALDVLEQYQRWRRFDTTVMALGMDGVNRLFSNDNPILRAFRDFGMGAVNANPALRRAFMGQAAGVAGKDVPKLLRGERV